MSGAQIARRIRTHGMAKKTWRRHPDSNREYKALQASALPIWLCRLKRILVFYTLDDVNAIRCKTTYDKKLVLRWNGGGERFERLFEFLFEIDAEIRELDIGHVQKRR